VVASDSFHFIESGRIQIIVDLSFSSHLKIKLISVFSLHEIEDKKRRIKMKITPKLIDIFYPVV